MPKPSRSKSMPKKPEVPVSVPAASDGSVLDTSTQSQTPTKKETLKQKKKVDARIPITLQNAISQNQRSMFVIVGDHGRDQVVNLHLFMSKTLMTTRPSVLWCYKKDLGFTSHRKKRMRIIKQQIKKGIKDPDNDDPFDLFVSNTDIRYTYYKDTPKILGQTFGMCVLQDFEALTPNLLARTIETVSGGGCIVLLIKTMSSLRQLYSLAMDVHSRYRTESHRLIQPRFNERFLLSIAGCSSCLIVDDELNVLPVSIARNSTLVAAPTDLPVSSDNSELTELKASLVDSKPVGPLINCTVTSDQAKAVLSFIDAIADKSLRSTVTLTAARGRGKSAALGLAMAAAIAYGYSNIFVTSPSPENLKTLFEFIFKGFDALEYQEHLDYDLVQSTNPALHKAIVRVNVFKNHRQTIQYIHPEDAAVLGQAELVVIDEAAAIPLPLVRKLIGPYLVFMASTVHGYEGTGRSLSLKLIQSLRKEQSDVKPGVSISESQKARNLREVTLDQPIRYAENDPVEYWLNKLLCLDASVSKTILGCPAPKDCDLYWVSRDTLFSHHPVSEAFLQRMMALYVASHYKNSPNDLQLMSDAPAHHLFVLLPPQAASNNSAVATLPEPIVVVQVALEGSISKASVVQALTRGIRLDGDMIPWCLSQQFQDDSFAQLSGARIVRIATHPDYMGMGYGSHAVSLLEQYYTCQFDLLEDPVAGLDTASDARAAKSDKAMMDIDLHSEQLHVKPVEQLPPLLLRLSQRAPERLDWIGVSFGLTRSLFKFWKRHEFMPMYLRQTANELTGEHTCIMVKSLGSENQGGWVDAFARDFRRRLVNLLPFAFRRFDAVTCISVLDAAGLHASTSTDSKTPLTAREVDALFTPHDLQRLQAYTNHLLDYHAMLDLVPILAHLYFGNAHVRHKVQLKGLQQSLLLALGLQYKTVSELEKEFGLPYAQIMALFLKVMRKMSGFLSAVQTRQAEEECFGNSEEQQTASDGMKPDSGKTGGAVATNPNKRSVDDEAAWDPVRRTMSDEEMECEQLGRVQLSDRQRALLESIDLSAYSVGGDDEEWAKATKSAKLNNPTTLRVSVKARKPVPDVLSADSSGLAPPRSDSNSGAIGRQAKKRKFGAKSAGPARGHGKKARK